MANTQVDAKAFCVQERSSDVTLTATRARELFSYDPETGELRCRAPRKRINVGDLAGKTCRFPSGRVYRQVGADRKLYYAHRIIWLMMTGEWPKGQIDHADNDGLNNAWRNLREATPTQNNANCHRRSHNTSGFKGVRRPDKYGKYSARLAGKHLGYFASPEDAHTAYVEAATAAYGEFARSA